MNPNPVHRLPAPIEAAVQRVKMAARDAVERTIESLGLAALASNNAFQRDALLGAQFELHRKSAVFVLTFDEAFHHRVVQEVAPRAPGSAAAGAAVSLDTLTLVDDHEVEIQVSAERFGLEIAHACEWELRELGAYIGPILERAGADAGRNPLRPDILGNAMIRAIEAVSDRPEVHKVLSGELGRSFSALLRGTYGDIVADLRRAGVQPMGLSVLNTGQRSTGGGPASGFDASGRMPTEPAESVHDSRYGTTRRGGGPGASTRAGGAGSRSAAALGQIDPALMSVMRRLAHGGLWGQYGTGAGPGGRVADGAATDWAGHDAAPLPNLIRAHRDELRQASNGSLDHMVIDVIGSLFDQILSDPKVSPQMARQIARLQLPVLRAALGDPSFFSSRRHPVRRFVNRIASLGAAYEDYTEEPALRFLSKVRALVQEVVEGDFDQIGVYEDKLAVLEAFIAEQGQAEVQAQAGAAELLSAKEDEQRLHSLYAQQLEGDLKSLAAPEFVRDFIARVWSQVLLRAAQTGDPEGARTKRLRHTGRELFMSVQPKANPAQRKAFLADLPKLMKELGEGMDLIGWPESARRAFFGQLLPTHAESLRATQGPRTLEVNLLARQVDGALERALPSRQEARARAHLPVLTEALGDAAFAPRFSTEEAQRVGLVEESAIDWDGKVDIDLGAEPEITAADVQITGLPQAAEPADLLEPTRGKTLADHVQIGFAYQMHLDGEWQKVRLAHVSPGRTFFVFNRGKRHKQAMSLTLRMLTRLCETGRLRAFENAYLLERATARARRQLAGVGGHSPVGAG